MIKFHGEEILQRGRGIGGVVKIPKMVFKPFTKTKSNFNGLRYYDDCRTCQQYGRVLHEIEGYDNKGFVNDEFVATRQYERKLQEKEGYNNKGFVIDE